MSPPTADRITILTPEGEPDIDLDVDGVPLRASDQTRNVCLPEGALPQGTRVRDYPIVCSNDTDGVVYSGEIANVVTQYHMQGPRIILHCRPRRLGPAPTP